MLDLTNIDEGAVAQALSLGDNVDPVTERDMNEALSPEPRLSDSDLLNHLKKGSIDKALSLDDGWMPKLIPDAEASLQAKIDRALRIPS